MASVNNRAGCCYGGASTTGPVVATQYVVAASGNPVEGGFSTTSPENYPEVLVEKPPGITAGGEISRTGKTYRSCPWHPEENDECGMMIDEWKVGA